MKPELSIIIQAYNGVRFFDTLFDSILKEKSTNYEIVIVVDVSSDGSYEFLKKKFHDKSFVRIFKQMKRGGTVAGVIRGIQEARSNIILSIGQDAKIDTGWSRSIPAFFRSHPDAAVAQAKILRLGTPFFDYAGDRLSNIGFLVERARSAKDTGQFNEIVKVFSVKGTAMIFRKDLFMKLGQLDPIFFFGWEEPEYTWRCWLAGYEVYYLPSVTVHHAFASENKTGSYYLNESNLFFHGCKNHLMTACTHYELGTLLQTYPLLIVSYIVIAMSFLFAGKPLHTKSIVRGIVWQLSHFRFIMQKRKKIQSLRVRSDDDIARIVGVKVPLSYYFGKAVSYVRGVPF